MESLIRRREMTETTGAIAMKPSPKSRLIIDTANETATVGGKLLRMVPRQYELLYLL